MMKERERELANTDTKLIRSAPRWMLQLIVRSGRAGRRRLSRLGTSHLAPLHRIAGEARFGFAVVAIKIDCVLPNYPERFSET